jgi:hypothetical protein
VRDLGVLFIHLFAAIAKLMRPGGACAVVAAPVKLVGGTVSSPLSDTS